MRVELKTIFLIDGLGALLTAFMLGIVLPHLSSLFGTPAHILPPLAMAAVCFAAYSFCCYWGQVSHWGFLAAIAVANVVYCLITITLVLWYLQQFTWLSILYFLAEVLIVLVLVAFEWMKVSRLRRGGD